MPRRQRVSLAVLRVLAVCVLSAFPCLPAATADIEDCYAAHAQYWEARDARAAREGEPEAPELTFAQICPETAAALAAHPYFSLLPENGSRLSLVDIQGLAELEQRYAGREALARVDRAALDQVLSRLEMDGDQEQSPWERLLAAAKAWWGDREVPEFNLLDDFALSERVVWGLLYTAVGAILLLTACLFYREVRATWRGHRTVTSIRWEQVVDEQQVLAIANLEAAPAREQPGLLLQLVLERLAAQGRLAPAASATHRDIAALAGASPTLQPLARLSDAAERARFGSWIPPASDLRALFALAQEAFGLRLEATP